MLTKGIGGQRRMKIADIMSPHMLPSKDARSIGATDRSGHERVRKQHSVCRQSIHVGRLDVRIAHRAQADLRLIIGKHE
jgi:hypothetical protein